MKLQKLQEYRWTSEELQQDQKAFFNTFDIYITKFESTEDNIETENNNSNNKLAFYRVIQTVLHLLIKLSDTEAQRFLNKPLLKKGNKITYT